MKNVLLALAMIAAGTAVAYMHVVTQSYMPVVRVSAPGGIVYTALMDAMPERQECGAANERFLGAIRTQCKDCKVVFARCERQTEAVDIALETEPGMQQRWVVSSGIRISVVGPAPAAQADCDQIAGDLVRRGVRSSACVQPPTKS